MPRQPKTDKARHVARVACKTAEELTQLHAIAKSRGMTFSGMVRHDYLSKDVRRVRTPREETLDRQLDTLANIFDEIKDQPTSELKEATMYSILTLAKYIIKERDDSKVQSPRKRPKAD